MKHNPGQIALDAIDASLVMATNYIEYLVKRDSEIPGIDELKRWRQSYAELHAWRVAFKKMAGAEIDPKYFADGTPCITEHSDQVAIAKAVLKARKVEGRRR